MVEYQFQDLTIKVFNDPTFRVGSADNNHAYKKYFFSDGAEEFPVSKHGIKIFKNDEEIDSCVVIASAGATAVSKNSSLLDKDRLLICCCDTLFCLKIPKLELVWKINPDAATCFQIFKLEDDYLIHGELEISRIDKNGNIKWQFGGVDIFVSIDGYDEFRIESDHIILTDFCKTRYKIDFDGKLLSSNYKQTR